MASPMQTFSPPKGGIKSNEFTNCGKSEKVERADDSGVPKRGVVS